MLSSAGMGAARPHDLDPERNAPEVEAAFEAVPPERVAEILDGRLAPRAKITISEVAVRLGFSPGAVREGLSRLTAEKWAIATAQKGYSVAPVSIEELKDLTRTRIVIEQLCLRSAIAHGDVEWETPIVAAYHRLHRIPVLAQDSASRVNDAWSAATKAERRTYDEECDVAFKGDAALGINIAGRHRLDWASRWHHAGLWEAPSLNSVDIAMQGHEAAADFKFTTSRHYVGRLRPLADFIEPDAD